MNGIKQKSKEAAEAKKGKEQHYNTRNRALH